MSAARYTRDQIAPTESAEEYANRMRAGTTATCRHCSNRVTYRPPTDKFIGGWVGDDHWGIVCETQTYGADTLHHAPTPGSWVSPRS